MKIAAIYDIHGNLPALEAVLDEIRAEHVDHIVVGGDAVLGPMSCETLARLRDLDVPVRYIRGNCEREVLASMAGEVLTIPKQYQPMIHWSAEELRAERDWLATWPLTCQLDVPPLGGVLFCHATPRDDNEAFTRLTAEERLIPIFAAPNVPLVVCGHSHMQFDRMIGAVRVVNAGSVGMPFAKPGAYWLLLGPDVQLRYTSYDLAAAAERIRGTNYPDADNFAARYVLDPPTEEAMLAVFTR